MYFSQCFLPYCLALFDGLFLDNLDLDCQPFLFATPIYNHPTHKMIIINYYKA